MSDDAPADAPEGPDFGPGGYLPQRAAKRARKIVLRAELGVQWIVASIVAGLLLLIAGVLWLGSGSDVPESYVEVVDVSALVDRDVGVHADGLFVLRTGGRVRVFSSPDPSLTLCTASGQLEAVVAGRVRVYSVTGRALTAGPSLTAYPVRVTTDAVYADVTAPLPVVAGRPQQETSPACLTPP